MIPARAGVTASPVRFDRQRARSVIRVVTGNFLEMYDFSVFGYYAAAIGRVYFPSTDPFASLMSALMTFGVGFLMRPLGALILGPYIDRRGRRAAGVEPPSRRWARGSGSSSRPAPPARRPGRPPPPGTRWSLRCTTRSTPWSPSPVLGRCGGERHSAASRSRCAASVTEIALLSSASSFSPKVEKAVASCWLYCDSCAFCASVSLAPWRTELS